MSTTPVVDVIMPTYNHGKFIGQAIESVLAQKTSFPYRLIVSDDCSTDNTPAVVRSYVEKHPQRMEFFSSPVNLGPLHRDRISIQLLARCTAKYVAILEGDDYWTNPFKLQKQVDYLEAHAECVVCFHNASMVFEDRAEPPRNYCSDDQKEISTLLDIATSCFLVPCTVLFRNHVLGPLPECFYEVTNADWMLFVLLGEHGNFGYLNEVMATYRVHSGGLWSKLDSMEGVRQHIKTYQTINAHLGFKYDRVLSQRIAALPKRKNEQRARYCLDQYHRFVKRGQIKDGLRVLFEALSYAPSQVLRPRHFAAVIKYGLLGSLSKSKRSELN